MERSRDYFEGTLQLRNPTKEVVRYVRSALKDAGVSIADEEKTVKGIDMKLSSQKFMQQLGKKLQKRFGGEFKISRKLFTVKRETSKRVYRLTVLFRLPEFKVRDTVKAKGRFINVTRMENKVWGKDIDSGKTISVKYEDVQP